MTSDDESADMLAFFFGQMQMHSPSMDGQHSYRFRSDGWPMTHCKGPTAEEAVRAAIQEIKRAKNDSVTSDAVKLREVTQQLAIAEDTLKEVARALRESEFDIAPCRLCGKPIVCIPDGMPMCQACAEAETLDT